jgi:hypothetical protein
MIEILKGKKQIVTLVAMWLLSTLTTESVHPGYITGVAITAIIVQAYLDPKGEKKNETNSNNLIGGNTPD